jgi:glycosyltransferase involved in cell wall biosynthesis
VGSGAGIAAWVERCAIGKVVGSGDADALAAAVCAALADREQRARWRANCATVVPEFSLESVAARLAALARELVI